MLASRSKAQKTRTPAWFPMITSVKHLVVGPVKHLVVGP